MFANELINLKKEDEKDYRFSHLYDKEVENYNLEIFYPVRTLSKEEGLNFFKSEGIF